MNLPVQPQPVEYRIIQDTDPDTLAEKVNKALQEGFVLHGPTTVTTPRGGAISTFVYVQPVARIEMVPVKTRQDVGTVIPAALPLIRP